MWRAALLLVLAGHAAALQPAVTCTHARRVHRAPTVHALAGGRGAALAAGLSLAASQAASADDVKAWAYSTLLDEIAAGHVRSALLSNDGKQVLTRQDVRDLQAQAKCCVEVLQLLRQSLLVSLTGTSWDCLELLL